MKRLVHFVAMSTFLSAVACDQSGSGEARPSANGGATAGARAGSGGAAGSGGGLATGGGGGGSGDIGPSGGSGGASSGGAAGGGSGGRTSAGADAGSGLASGSGGGAGGDAATTKPTAGASGNGGAIPTGGGTAAGGAKSTGGSTTVGATGGSGGGAALGCTACHGDSASNDPAPPSDTTGKSDTSSPGVGAHARHLAASTWHRQGKCADCHVLPTSVPHSNGKVDFSWSPPSNASNAKPAFDTASLTCAGAYCHGTSLPGASLAKTKPIWNQVDETWNDCGTACHATPPPASTGHPSSSACETCHSKVIASFKATSPSTTWKDASLHINGTVDVDALTCTSCHGSGTNPAPPKDTNGNTATTAAGVGAHAQHLASSSWHRQGQCSDCHATPTANTHANNTVDFAWGAVSKTSGASPSFDGATLACAGTYCHGTKMTDQTGSIGRVPVWTKVDGTYDACGGACHATPPKAGSHTSTSTACEGCHGDVIASFKGATSTWKNASLHINGKVEASAMSCSSCHGNPPDGGTHRRGEHKVACANCHPDSSGTTHRNGKTDVTCGSSKAGCHGNDD